MCKGLVLPSLLHFSACRIKMIARMLGKYMTTRKCNAKLKGKEKQSFFKVQ